MKTKTSIFVLGLITANILLFIMFMQSKDNTKDLLSNQASAIYIGISAVLMLIVMCNIIIENGKAKQ